MAKGLLDVCSCPLTSQEGLKSSSPLSSLPFHAQGDTPSACASHRCFWACRGGPGSPRPPLGVECVPLGSSWGGQSHQLFVLSIPWLSFCSCVHGSPIHASIQQPGPHPSSPCPLGTRSCVLGVRSGGPGQTSQALLPHSTLERHQHRLVDDGKCQTKTQGALQGGLGCSQLRVRVECAMQVQGCMAAWVSVA